MQKIRSNKLSVCNAVVLMFDLYRNLPLQPNRQIIQFQLMAYRLKVRESVSKGIKRIATEQIDKAIAD